MKQGHKGKGKPSGGHEGGGAAGQKDSTSRAGFPLQSAIGNRGFANLFREQVGPPGDAFEQEADRASQAVTSTGSTGGMALTAGAGGLQRKCAECAEEEDETIRRSPTEESASETAPSETAPQAEAAPQVPAAEEEQPAEAEVQESTPLLIVEDDIVATRGQMTKTQFLSALRGEVTATADEALAGTGQTSAECPWIDYWFGYYGEQDAAHVEGAIRKYAPEAAKARSASDYFAAVSARVRRSVLVWSKTGEVTGVPDVPGAGAAGILSTVAGLFFKARPGGARNANPASVRDSLGGGKPLPGETRTRMESAFGSSFAGVRVHTDGTAAQLSDQLNARAFTVGQHVAFGSGEYHPGTIAGDALMAHELAHVVQQGAAPQAGVMGKGPESSGELEEDADRSAVSAVTSLWGGIRGGMANAGPSLRSGLQLSRCSKGGDTKAGSTETLAVKVRPVSIANDDGSAKTALPSFDAAKRIWKKACIDVTVEGEKTVKKSAYKTLDETDTLDPSAEETAMFADAGASGGAISVFVADQFTLNGVTGKNVQGGGVSYDQGKAEPKCIVVEGVDGTVVAHEMGHGMGRGQHGPAGTVMDPSGSHDKPVAETLNADIISTVRGFTSATKTGKKDCTL